MFDRHFQSGKREGYRGRCYNRHSFRPCLQGVNVSREEGSLAYPYYPGRANVLSRFTWQNLANSLHEKQKVFSTRRVTWGTYHLHGKTGISGWKIKWLAPSVWDTSENMACNLRGWHFWIIIWGRWAVSQRRIMILIFLLFLVSSDDLDILCSGSFSYDAKFYSFMFMQKISTPVVCVNGKHPCLAG